MTVIRTHDSRLGQIVLMIGFICVALNCNPQSNNRTIMSPHAPISFLWGNSHVVPFRDNKEHLPYKLGFSQMREKLWMVF